MGWVWEEEVIDPFRLTILVRAPHNIHCTTALPSRWMVIQEKGVAIFALPFNSS
jgi:hypothetical protein